VAGPLADPAGCDPDDCDAAALPHAAASSPAATGTLSFTGAGTRASNDLPMLTISCFQRYRPAGRSALCRFACRE
jgi:hypothetical protein